MMKNIKLHIMAVIIVIIAEFIGIKSFKIGSGSIVLLPMLYAMVIGLLITPRFLNLAKEKDMDDAGSLIGLTLMLLMAKYGTNIGPTLPQVIKSGPALILQELGNLGTVFLGVPLGVMIGLKREAIGGAHSVSREANVALIGDKYGLDSPEGQGVLGVYIVGTVFGTPFVGLITSMLATYTPLHPYALAMASGVGSASMMTAGVGSLTAMYPEMESMLVALGASSNLLSGLDGLYMSLFISLPLAEYLYKKTYKFKYGDYPGTVVAKEAKLKGAEKK